MPLVPPAVLLVPLREAATREALHTLDSTCQNSMLTSVAAAFAIALAQQGSVADQRDILPRFRADRVRVGRPEWLVGTTLARSSSAQQSGVLLGVAERQYGDVDSWRYTTLWIVNDQSRPLRATVSDLLVPRRDGFWRMGVIETCTVLSPDFPEPMTRDVVWRARLGELAVVNTGCEGGDSTTRPDSLVDSTVANDSTKNDPCHYETTWIGAVTADLIGYWSESGKRGWCESRGFDWLTHASVRRFAGDSALPLDSLLGAGAKAAYTSAITGPFKHDTTFQCPELEADDVFDDWLVDWTIERDAGRWQPFAFHQPYASAACQYQHAIKSTKPIVRNAPLRPAWRVIHAAVPNLVDATTSPGGDLTVATTPDSVFVFASNGGTVGRRLFAAPLDGPRLVMIEWATGANVARWNQAVLSTAAQSSGVRAVPR